MPRYIALKDTWLSHECRIVKEGVEFETTFPKAKDAKGELVEMRLSEGHLECLDAPKKKAPNKKGADKQEAPTAGAEGEGSEGEGSEGEGSEGEGSAEGSGDTLV